MEDVLRTLEEQERIRRILDPVQDQVRTQYECMAMNSVLQDAQRMRDLAPAALDPLDEVRRAGWIDVSPEISNLDMQTLGIREEIDGQHCLPGMSQIDILLEGIEVHRPAFLLSPDDSVQRANEALQHVQVTWLDIDGPLKSTLGMAVLHDIGYALSHRHPYEDEVTDFLRAELGDWRSQIDWPPEIFTDIHARTAFYAERGLDEAISSLPAPAFHESLMQDGLMLRHKVPAFTHNHEFEEEEEDEQEVALRRTNAAHDCLQRFETRLRMFIQTKLKKAMEITGSSIVCQGTFVSLGLRKGQRKICRRSEFDH